MNQTVDKLPDGLLTAAMAETVTHLLRSAAQLPGLARTSRLD